MPTWLARIASRPEWKAPPSDRRHLGVAVPAELEHLALGASSESDRWRPAEVALVCTTRSRSPAASGGPREPYAERARDAGAGGVHVDERHVDTGDTGSSRATQHPTMPAPTTVTRSPTSGALPQCVDRGLDRAGQHGTVGGDVVRTGDHGIGGDDVRRLVRVEAEDGAAAQGRGPSSTTPTLR